MYLSYDTSEGFSIAFRGYSTAVDIFHQKGKGILYASTQVPALSQNFATTCCEQIMLDLSAVVSRLSLHTFKSVSQLSPQKLVKTLCSS